MIQTSAVTAKYRTRGSWLQSWSEWQTATFQSTTEMVSVSHAPVDVTIDDGGPWLLRRTWDTPEIVEATATDPYRTFEGQFAVQPHPTGWSYTPVQEASAAELNANGTTAIARTAPTNPAFDLSTSLGELVSDGVPSMVGSALLFKERARRSREAGGEYLNVEFGWKPLISDVRNFAKVVKQSEQLLNQYRRDSGQKIRRGYSFPGEYSTRLLSDSVFSAPMNYSFPGVTTEELRKEAWFSGAFRYHIPVSDGVVGKFQQWASLSDHLLGWKVTPETLWNIAPWSWAVDWFTNTGDILANISNLGKDGLVLQYGYSMCHTRRKTTVTGSPAPWQTPAASISRVMLSEWKQRRPATPFGFGADLTSLSGRQIAILAALGLSRA